MKKLLSKAIGSFLSLLFKMGALDDILNIVNSVGIHKSLVPGDMIRQVLAKAVPGDIILVKAFGEATSLLIGGDYTHSAMVVSEKNLIADATGALGVSKRDILNLFQGISAIRLIRLKDATDGEMVDIVDKASFYTTKKIRYDYGYASNKEEMYCSEFLSHVINDILPGTLELRPRFGKATITPDDLSKASRIFDTVFEYRT